MTYPPARKASFGSSGCAVRPYRDGSGRARLSATIDWNLGCVLHDEAMATTCTPSAVLEECLRRALPELAAERMRRALGPVEPLVLVDRPEDDPGSSGRGRQILNCHHGDVADIYSLRGSRGLARIKIALPCKISEALHRAASELGVGPSQLIEAALRRAIPDLVVEHAADRVRRQGPQLDPQRGSP